MKLKLLNIKYSKFSFWHLVYVHYYSTSLIFDRWSTFTLVKRRMNLNWFRPHSRFVFEIITSMLKKIIFHFWFACYFSLFQGGHFDLPDRLFHSVKDSWLSSSESNMADIKELIPEFFYLPDFLMNQNKFDLGEIVITNIFLFFIMRSQGLMTKLEHWRF